MDPLQWLSLSLLAVLLLAATVVDLRTRRIPNALVAYGTVMGLLLQAIAPAGQGLLQGGALGLPAALLGGLVGLGLFLPFHALRMLGAGDVKLLAMAGAWLGAQGVAYAALWSLIAGGVLVLLVTLASGMLAQVGRNLLRIGRSAAARAAGTGIPDQAPVQIAGRLPYAVAIATGTSFEMARLLSA